MTPLPQPTSRQEALDGVVARIIAQGGPSRSSNGNCVYRSEFFDQECACAIGHLVDDETALAWDGVSEFGSLGVITLSVRGFLPDFLEADKEFYSRLQAAHDETPRINFFPDFFINIRRLCSQYDLTIPESAR